jgi:hypothetical protein
MAGRTPCDESGAPIPSHTAAIIYRAPNGVTAKYASYTLWADGTADPLPNTAADQECYDFSGSGAVPTSGQLELTNLAATSSPIVPMMSAKLDEVYGTEIRQPLDGVLGQASAAAQAAYLATVTPASKCTAR